MSVLDLLDQEWARPATETAAAWRLRDVCDLAGGAQSLDDVERFVRMADGHAVDAVLAALAARSVRGDRLAARVLLQLLLPGVRRLARTWTVIGDTDEAAAATVAAVYERIRRYPIGRRPHRIASNILTGAEHDLRRWAMSRRCGTGRPSWSNGPGISRPGSDGHGSRSWPARQRRPRRGTRPLPKRRFGPLC